MVVVEPLTQPAKIVYEQVSSRDRYCLLRPSTDPLCDSLAPPLSS